MQKLDRATLTELYWRDFIFWIIARPLGIIYGLLSGFLINLVFFLPRRAVYLLDRKKNISPYLETEFLKKEVFTLANLMSLYGLFLCGQLFNWYLHWMLNFELPKIYSISAVFIYYLPYNPARLLSWQILEIFLTDIIDGPLARLNMSVTALGTFLDHFRDYKIGSISFLILITLTIQDAYTEMLILELAALAGFLGIFIYHGKFFRLKIKNYEFQSSGFWGKIKERIAFLCDFALNEYQTDLIGRIQFGATAFAISSGLFYFATQKYFIHIAFIISMTISLAVTYFYIYKLWGRHMEKLRESMQVRSDRMKEKLVDKTIELKDKAAQKISAGEKIIKSKEEN